MDRLRLSVFPRSFCGSAAHSGSADTEVEPEVRCLLPFEEFLDELRLSDFESIADFCWTTVILNSVLDSNFPEALPGALAGGLAFAFIKLSASMGVMPLP